MRKIILLFLGLFFTASVYAQSGGERIRSFSTSIEIQKSGKIHVTEKILYDFNSNYRHGIYRDIPQIVYRENNNKYVLKYDRLSVTDENGKHYRNSTSYLQEHLRLKIGDPDRTISGAHTYVISYEVSGALNYLTDHTELYWNSTGDQWDVPIDSAQTTVVLPKNISGMHLKLACYTGSLGSSESSCTASSEANVETFNSKRPLLAKEGMTVVVGFPNGIVATLQAEKFIPFSERWYGRLIIGAVFLLALLWYIVYPVWIVVKWFRYGKDPRPFEGEVRAWFDPPKTEKGRALTPAETGSLIDERVDGRDVSAVFVDLARRGYLKMEERKKKDFYLMQTNTFSKSDSLQPFEKKLLDELFKSEKVVQVKTAKLYSLIQSIKSTVYTTMVEDGFFAKNPNNTRTFYIVVALLGLMTFNIQLALVCVLFGIHMAQKTQAGANAAAVARSLKNFLGTQERQLTFQASKQMMFERLLPFAVAFGVEKIWAERFKDIHLKQPAWYSGTGTGAFNSAAFVSSLDSSLKSVSVAGQPPHSSSGSGFSGGFSGGGGGGGGGGSW